MRCIDGSGMLSVPKPQNKTKIFIKP